MLEQSYLDLQEASSVERHVSEIVAHNYLVSELVENLIPPDEADRIIEAHNQANDETWLRAVYAAMRGLRAAEQSGFKLTIVPPE